MLRPLVATLNVAIASFVLVSLMFVSAPAAALTRNTPPGAYEIIYTFGSQGSNPTAALVAGADGKLYGTTQGGGTYGRGTMFSLEPYGSLYHQTVLFSFGKTRRAWPPLPSLIGDQYGAFYGTTQFGGLKNANCLFGKKKRFGCGTVFKLTPSGSTYIETVIHYFEGGSDGYYPYSGLAMDSGGVLYGTTNSGGGGNGTAFKLTSQGSAYTETVIHGFFSSGPTGTLLLLNGDLYGMTASSGSSNAGSVFRLSTDGTSFTTLYNFRGGSADGQTPQGGLATDGSGALYGTTIAGGTFGDGTVFKLTPSGTGDSETILHSFDLATDGSLPVGNVVVQKNVVYGVTARGGSPLSICDCGTVYKIAPKNKGGFSVIHAFAGAPDGAYPYLFAGLYAYGGILYGTAYDGGSSNRGVVYSVTP